MTTAEEFAKKLENAVEDPGFKLGDFAPLHLGFIAAKLREQERLLMSQQRKISFLISASKCGAVITEVEEDMLRDPAKELLP